jgi:outer membrane protein assembly factor BamD (BamD/ComL family)
VKKSSVLASLVTVAVTALLTACSSNEADWQQASSVGTVAAYIDFLKNHPNGQHADEARDRIRQLQDDDAWRAALAANTEQSYRQYLSAEPHGAHAQEAHDRITDLQRAAAWKTAEGQESASTLEDFIAKYPQGSEADAARAALDKLNHAYRVQLAAFHTRKAAEHDRRVLESRFRGVLHAVVVLPPTPPDKLNRVDSELMSQSDADSLCAKLKKSHQSCKVVKTTGAA